MGFEACSESRISTENHRGNKYEHWDPRHHALQSLQFTDGEVEAHEVKDLRLSH